MLLKFEIKALFGIFAISTPFISYAFTAAFVFYSKLTVFYYILFSKALWATSNYSNPIAGSVLFKKGVATVNDFFGD